MNSVTLHIRQNGLLQEGVSAALATLHAIAGAGLLDSLPEEPGAAVRHNHGLALLHMLEDQLCALQEKVDALDGTASAQREEA